VKRKANALRKRYRAAGPTTRQTRKRTITRENVATVPESPGVYILYGTRGAPAYIGATSSLRRSLERQLETGRIPAATFAYRQTRTLAEAQRLERPLIARLLPRFNVQFPT
jgi:excinuclease UvrABC nuclease subunit